MGRRFIAVFAMAAVAGAGFAQAGQGLKQFSVDSDPAKAAKAPAVVAKTPEGIACPLGIAKVKALADERFEYAGKPYAMRDLSKALRAANKPKKFDCVVIEGGKPPSVDAMKRIVKDLSGKPVKHVEWGGAQPDAITKPGKK